MTLAPVWVTPTRPRGLLLREQAVSAQNPP